MRFAHTLCAAIALFLSADSATALTGQTEDIQIRAKAGADGKLVSVQLEAGVPFAGPDMLKKLRAKLEQIHTIIETNAHSEPPIVLQIDDRLQFQEVSRLLLVISRKTAADGKVVPMFKSVRLWGESFIMSGSNDEYLKYLDSADRDKLTIRFDPPLNVQEKLPE